MTAIATDATGAVTVSSPITVTVTAPPFTAYYIENDQLNTPRVITDDNRNVVWKWDSEPFGSTPPDEAPNGQGSPFVFNLRFPGQYFDRETNLHYNYYRDYDPSIGKYLESDPIGLRGGLNTYLYANANPLSYVDPTGEIVFLAPAVWFGGEALASWLLPAAGCRWHGHRGYHDHSW